MCIVASTAHASHRQIVSGVVDYVDRHVDWETILFSSLDDFHKFRTTGGPVKADGMLAGVGQVRDIEAVRSDRYPTVLMGFGARGFPSVQSDELAIGEMACEHFLRLGMRHLACCGLPRVGFAEQRMAAFVAHAARQGLTVQTYPRPVYAEITQHPHELRHLHKWLKSLPQSVGLFCPVTNISAVVLRQCRHLGIAVPEQVALLGVDDDEILCSLSHPRLSAVDQAPERIGYEAAAMLNRILSGARAPAEPILIKPRSVIARASTDIINSDNPYVAQAIRFIRDHVEDGINVSDVMRAVPMSRRGL